MNTDFIFNFWRTFPSAKHEVHTQYIAVCMCVVSTDGSVSDKHNDFREQWYTFLFSMEQVIVTDISCFTFSDLENGDSTKFTSRAKTPFSKTLSVCQSLSSTPLWQKQIPVSPCGAFSLTGWGICQKRHLIHHTHSFPSDELRCILAVQNLNECLSELNIKGGVNDGIYGTIHIAQPGESIIHLSGNLATCAVGVQDMGNEKWQPTYDEYTCRETKRN